MSAAHPLTGTWRQPGPVVVRDVNDVAEALVSFVAAVELKVTSLREGDTGTIVTGEFSGDAG